MKTKRRNFLKWTSLLGLTAAGSNAFLSPEKALIVSAQLTKNTSAPDYTNE